jgi:hypothetical protein
LYRRLKSRGSSAFKTRHVPATATLTLTSYAPFIPGTANQTVTPTTRSVILTGRSPTITSVGGLIVPTTRALTVTRYAPTVTRTLLQRLTPTTKMLTMTRYAPTISVASGSSGYPPDTQLTNVTPPTPPAIPAYLTPTIYSPWGTTITRVSNVSYQRNIYSRTAGWNSDESMILLSGYQGAPAAVISGQAPYTFLHNLPFLVGMGQWANTNPAKIYGTWIEENYLRSQTYNGGSSWTLNIEHTFSGYTSISLGDSEGGISDDDDTFVLMTRTSGGANGMLVYDRSSDSVVATRNFGAQRPDTCFVSRSGNYAFAYWSNGDGTGAQQGLWLYDRNLNIIRQVTPEARHGDPARLADGTEVWAQVNYGGEYFRLDNGAHTYLFDSLNPYPHNTAFTVGHCSGRAVNRNGWVYLSQYNYPATYPGSTYGRDQIVAANMDDPGTVEVFGWSNHRANGDTSAGYYTSPFATPSRDGTKVLFGSEWGDLTEPYGPVYAYVAEQL